ncbi:hypothetical protein BH18THE1_BH18THE1_01540 [soil metagenome]
MRFFEKEPVKSILFVSAVNGEGIRHPDIL